MSRPSIRRALRRLGAETPLRAPRPTGEREAGRIPPPKIFLPGETEDAGRIDFSLVFGRVAPVEMEIGVGKGRFLLAAAALHGGRNWFGLEIEPGYARVAQLRAVRAGLSNLRIELLDGKAFVLRRLSPGCLAGLHVYFPDPWPKKRHHKRRLVDPAWAAAAAFALAPASLLRVASDHSGYFGVIDDVLSNEPLLEKLGPAEAGAWSTGTSYELKYLKTGRPIYKAVFRRRTSGSAS